MDKFLILILLLLLNVPQVIARKTFKTKDYVPQKIGYRWQFKNRVKDGLSPIIIHNSQKVAEKVRRDENNGDYRLQSITNRGLEIHQLYFVGNRLLTYEKPVVLFPGKFVLGKLYESETRYKTFVENELKEVGRQIYAVKAERTEDVETPLQIFKDCLVIRTTALRIDEAGSQKGYELEEWYAKKVGAVKVLGKLFWKNSKGETIRTFIVDAELERFSR